MFHLKRILFPVDFSDRSLRAASYAEAFAGRFDAELVLLHVIEPPTYNSTMDDLREIRPEQIETFFGPELKQLRTTRAIERGEAGRTIVEYACKNNVDLIMMPTNGLGIFRRLIIGSNTAKVLHDADCPVWTGIHLENAPPLDEIKCRRVLCAVDLKPVSAKVLDWAHWMAQEYQAELVVTHVTPEMAGGAARYFDGAFDAAMREEAAKAIDELQKTVGSNAEVRIETGDPAATVACIAKDVGADLLVVGRKPERGFVGRLATHTYSIVRQSPCPVVSV
jgi:nucleotide-binding universal stress UspA family protein